jgi:hypothetical protein
MFARVCVFCITAGSVATKCSLRQKINTVKELFWAVYSCLAFVVPTAFAESRGFRLTSSEWHDGGSVPHENVFNGSGCGGANISPEFHWSDAPSGTKSFASLSLIPTLRLVEDGGIGLFSIFQERSRSYLQALATTNQEGCHLLAFNAGMIMGNRDMGGPVLRLDQPIDIW